MLSRQRWPLVVIAVVISCSLNGMSALQAAQAAAKEPKKEAAPRGGRLKARLLDAEGKKPIAGAVVHAYQLEAGKMLSSGPSDSHGRCEIDGIPYGYLDISVETREGTFVANKVVNVPPAGSLVITFTLTKFGEHPPSWWSERERKQAAAREKAATGYASIAVAKKGIEFWKSPKGIAIIAGTSGAALLAVAAGAGESSSSTFQP